MATLRTTLLLTTILSAPLSAQERQLDAHEHGTGEMTIAIAGNMIDLEFHAPGADIVGFEYEATSEEDLAAVEAALAVLSEPLSIFVLPEAAGCVVTAVEAELELDHSNHDHGDHSDEAEHDDHDDHDHDEAEHDDHDDHDHDEAEHDDHDDHDHDEAEHDDHDDHDHDEAEHEHDDHAHDDHDDHDKEEAAEAGHSEFHGHYLLTCDDTSAVTSVTFAYFDTFPNALEVEIEMVTDTGAGVFDASREEPVADLSSAF